MRKTRLLIAPSLAVAAGESLRTSKELCRVECNACGARSDPLPRADVEQTQFKLCSLCVATHGKLNLFKLNVVPAR